MSVPRVFLVPTHRTGLANALAAALSEILVSQGVRARYHHVGTLSAAAAWDRWEGAAFLDPALYDENSLLALYDVATRGASLSLLSSSRGILDSGNGSTWLPSEVALALDCPLILVLDCRGWGTGIGALVAGMQGQLKGLNVAGAILTGVEDRDHYETLRVTLLHEGVEVVGCLYQGDGPGWDSLAPGPWQLPLDSTVIESVSRQLDLEGIQQIAGQRGFLSPPTRLSDHGADGPLVVVAGGKGFTPWSRDSIEVLRSCGAQIRRLDLMEDEALPEDAAGLVLAGTAWPAGLSDISHNRPLMDDLCGRIRGGLPTIAMGSGMLLLLSRLQDSLGRTIELTNVLPAEGEVLWDLDEATYVEVTAEADNLLLNRGESVTGWVVTEAEIQYPEIAWESPLTLRSVDSTDSQPDGAGSSSLLCTRALIHLCSNPEMGRRFVSRCALHAAKRGGQDMREIAPAS